MIGYIKGKVLSCNEGTVLIENNGIGYEVVCSSSVYKKLLEDGQGEVYTYMAVKEDGVSLYGFIDLNEKALFLKLISVSSVGAKTGIGILSSMSVQAIALAIATNDVKALSSIKGLGKKTAERIILELREKVGDCDTQTGEIFVEKRNETSAEEQDAIIALQSLGFTKAECVKAVAQAKNNGNKGVEQLIASAIKHIR